MNKADGKVYIVDDDEAVRRSLQLLLKTVNIDAVCFASGDEFIARFDAAMQGCIVLDIRMPGLSGLEVQKQLKAHGNTMPIVFITGHGDVPMAVEAMQQGAFDFVQKPFREQELMDRVSNALSHSQELQQEETLRRDVAERYASLTPREKDVMACVVKGQANKVIAMDRDVSQRTIEIHRARVMEKMQVKSLAELVRMSLLLGEN
ncbi:MAG: response regulator transcription factor [Gammaproteobacteria bacterium]|jgi:FixJ family two-component response regulator|nr:response regulator transcription factor [Gammaproteobacteria bacterium]